MNWVLDLDGVVWLADRPIAGSAEAVARLVATGANIAFVTNNSNPVAAEYEAKLERHGIEDEDLVGAGCPPQLVAPDVPVRGAELRGGLREPQCLVSGHELYSVRPHNRPD